MLSGTLGTDASGRVAAGDVKAQTRQALENLRAAAARAGASLERAAKVNVFLRRASDFAAMNEVYSPSSPADPPARTTVVTGAARSGRRSSRSRWCWWRRASRARWCTRPAWKRSPNPYSYGIRSGDTLFLAGLVSRRGADNSLVAGDMAAQTRTMLDNAAELLHAAGMDFSDVVSSRVYITSAAGFARHERRLRRSVSRATRRRERRSASS